MKNNTSVFSISSAICLILLVSMWAFAGFSKLMSYEAFRFELLGHEVLAEYAYLVAWMVPAFELLISLGLIIPKTRKRASIASGGLLVVFIAYIIYMFKYYPNTPCSCGGFIAQLDWKQHIVFNIAFAVISLYLVIEESKELRLFQTKKL